MGELAGGGGSAETPRAHGLAELHWVQEEQSLHRTGAPWGSGRETVRGRKGHPCCPTCKGAAQRQAEAARRSHPKSSHPKSSTDSQFLSPVDPGGLH